MKPSSPQAIQVTVSSLKLLRITVRRSEVTEDVILLAVHRKFGHTRRWRLWQAWYNTTAHLTTKQKVN